MNLDQIETLWSEFQANSRGTNVALRPQEFARQHGLSESDAKLLPVLQEFQNLRATQQPKLKQIGSYTILELLGEGGMGIVYKCSSPAHDKPIAIKVIRPGNLLLHGSGRFDREALVTASLTHSNIVPIYDIGSYDVPYYTMHLVEGPTLANLVHTDWSTKVASTPAEKRARQLSGLLANNWSMQATIGSQCANALSYAHGKGVLHRDVKPANLLLDKRLHVWVTDFGLAKKLFDHQSVSMRSNLLGTPRYMSPEQLRGDADERSDVFGLGLVLYELALLSADGKNTRRAIWKGGLRPIREWNPSVPLEYERIILKAVNADPNSRFQTAKEFEDALLDIAKATPRDTHQSLKASLAGATTTTKPVRQRPRVLTAVVSVLLLYMAFLITFGVFPNGSFGSIVAKDFVSDSPGRRASQFTATDQIQINPSEPLSQRFSYHAKAIAFGNDGSGAVVYTSLYQDGEDYGIYARYVQPDGQLGQEFRVANTTKGNQKHGTVACLSNGNRIFAWDSNRDQDENSTEVMIRAFDATGEPLGDEIQVNTTVVHSQIYPNIIVNSKDEVIVAWRSKHQDGDSYGVFMRRFSSTLQPLTGEIRVNAETVGPQKNPMVAIGPNDELAVTWHSRERDDQRWSVFARCFDETGQPLSDEFEIAGGSNDVSKTYPRVIFDQDGNILVVYRSVERNAFDSIRCRRFSCDGNALTSEIVVSPPEQVRAKHCSITRGADGCFVVVWQSTYDDPTGYDVFARVLYPDGMVRSDVLRVNDERLGEQYLAWVEMTSSYKAMVVWSGLGPADDSGVHAKWLTYEPLVPIADTTSSIVTTGEK